MGQNTSITQQPTPLAPYPPNNYGMPTIAPTVPTLPEYPTDSVHIPLNPNPSPPYPSAPTFSTLPDSDGIDPPTYEEAMEGSSVDVNGKVFKPSYPVFRRTPSYSIDTNN